MALSGGLVILLVILLYRRIKTIGRISLLLWVGVVATLLWLIWGGVTHFDRKMAFDFPPAAFHLSTLWFAALGSAMEQLTQIHTPGAAGIQDVVDLLSRPATQMLKCMLFDAGGRPVGGVRLTARRGLDAEFFADGAGQRQAAEREREDGQLQLLRKRLDLWQGGGGGFRVLG